MYEELAVNGIDFSVFVTRSSGQSNGDIIARASVAFPPYSSIKDISWYYDDSTRSSHNMRFNLLRLYPQKGIPTNFIFAVTVTIYCQVPTQMKGMLW